MHEQEKSQRAQKKRARTLVCFLLSFLIFGCIYLVAAFRSVENEKAQYQALADGWVEVARDRMGRIMAPTLYLEAELNGEADEEVFSASAWGYIQEVREQQNVRISSVTIAPNGIVENVYPLKGNEGMLGANLLDPVRPQARAVADAMDKREPVMSAPVRPMPTAHKLYICIPLLRGEGVAMIAIDMEDFVELLPLEPLESIGAVCELEYVDQANNHWVMLDAGLDKSQTVISQFSLLGVEWTLDMMPAKGWMSATQGAIAIFLILLLSGLVTAVFWSQINLSENNEELKHRAYYDGLTMAHTRQYVYSVLVDKATGQWKNDWNKYSLVLVDVDNLKHINDHYGHELGDISLAAVGDLLNSLVNPEEGECVIRHGGDEFVVLFNHILPSAFHDKLAAMVKGARALTFPDYPGFGVTLSVGGELYSGCRPVSYEEMLNRADEKLYRAKEGGRNQFAM